MYSLILAFLVSILLITALKSFAIQLNLVDIPNDRSVHVRHTPRGAGIGMVLAVVLAGLLVYPVEMWRYHWIWLALLNVFAVGVFDDCCNTSAKAKFFIMGIGSGLVFLDGVVIDHIGSAFGLPVALGWFALPFTMFAVTGLSNAFNLIDGLDGLVGSVGLVILLFFAVTGARHDDPFLLMFTLPFIGALLAFLLFNWAPASIFMGDSGSLTIGFVISVLAIHSMAYYSAVGVLFIVMVPLLDTLIIMIRRKRKHRSIFASDQCHLHHILFKVFDGNTHRTVLAITAVQVVYVAMGIMIPRGMDEGVLLLLFLLNTAVVYRISNMLIGRYQLCREDNKN